MWAPQGQTWDSWPSAPGPSCRRKCAPSSWPVSPSCCSPGRAPCRTRAASPRGQPCPPSWGRRAGGTGGRAGTAPADMAGGTPHRTCGRNCRWPQAGGKPLGRWGSCTAPPSRYRRPRARPAAAAAEPRPPGCGTSPSRGQARRRRRRRHEPGPARQTWRHSLAGSLRSRSLCGYPGGRSPRHPRSRLRSRGYGGVDGNREEGRAAFDRRPSN